MALLRRIDHLDWIEPGQTFQRALLIFPTPAHATSALSAMEHENGLLRRANALDARAALSATNNAMAELRRLSGQMNAIPRIPDSPTYNDVLNRAIILNHTIPSLE